MSGLFERAKSKVCLSEGMHATARPLVSTWEQRKLGDVTAVYDGVHQTPDYQDEGVMFLSVENIETLTSQKFISREAFARDYPVYPKRGDVLMTRIGDIGTSNVVEADDKLAFYVSLALLKPLNVDSYYLDKSLQSPSAKMELYRRTLHIAFPKKINKNQIAEVMLPIPRSRQEQEQIGALFRDLDTLITLHQHEPTHMMKEGKNANRYQWRIAFPRLLLAMD